MKNEFTLDFSDFNKKFKNITQTIIPKKAERGLGRAGLQLMNDAIMQSPTVPIKEGWLRGSGSVFVGNKLVAESSHGKKGKANKEHNESKALVAVVGFNTPYAARLHESANLRFAEPSAGPKFLLSKMSRNKEIYMQIIANALKEGEK